MAMRFRRRLLTFRGRIGVWCVRVGEGLVRRELVTLLLAAALAVLPTMSVLGVREVRTLRTSEISG